MQLIKSPLVLSSILFFILLFPFISHDSEDMYSALPVDDISIGNYQSSTCKISLYEVYLKNFNSQNVEYRPHNYAGTECFGKVTGVDKKNDTFIVSIGVNPSLSFLIQIILWCGFLLLAKKNDKNRIKFSNISLVLLPLIFTFQHFSEQRFYLSQNKYFSTEFSTSNYYLFIIFLTVYLFCIFTNMILENRINQLINYIPFTFLIVGTFNGLNLNFYILLFTLLGVNNLSKHGFNSWFNKGYLFFSIFWLFSHKDSNSFFDTDKLRGLINSSNTLSSQFYWILITGLVINGFYFLYLESEINIKLLLNNFLITGAFVSFLGVIGSISSLFNFFNFYLFGQNKLGMSTFSSIAGNTWRGFSASAESLGEFYGFIILFYIICFYLNMTRIRYWDIPMLAIIAYGLYRSNNFAVIFSISLFVILIVLYKKLHHKVSMRILFVSMLIFTIFLATFVGNKYEYENLSSGLLYEASLHSNFYKDQSNYSKTILVTKFFEDSDLGTLFNIENPESGSSLLRNLVKIYTPQIDIPFFPNIVTIASTLATLINRTEMWGIFIAKYSPNLVETFFGNGPYQLNNYLYFQEVRLDLPEQKLTSLFLPHSSLADLFIFTGLIGVGTLGYLTILLIKKKSSNGAFKLLLIFLLINFLKSDSLLYINSVMLVLIAFSLVAKDRVFSE